MTTTKTQNNQDKPEERVTLPIKKMTTSQTACLALAACEIA